MSISLDASPSGSISKSEYLSSLPRWRRWLSKLNWHPVVEIEIRAIERETRMLRIESEILQLKSENARLAELNARIAALWPNSNSSSAPTAPPEEGSQT
jgi:hypothetical protein